MNPKLTLEEARSFPLFFLPVKDSAATWRAFRFDVDVVVCMNDFPDQPLYTLLLDGVPVGSFNDWPERWKKLS